MHTLSNCWWFLSRSMLPSMSAIRRSIFCPIWRTWMVSLLCCCRSASLFCRADSFLWCALATLPLLVWWAFFLLEVRGWWDLDSSSLWTSEPVSFPSSLKATCTCVHVQVQHVHVNGARTCVHIQCKRNYSYIYLAKHFGINWWLLLAIKSWLHVYYISTKF